jgi:zinc protease
MRLVVLAVATLMVAWTVPAGSAGPLTSEVLENGVKVIVQEDRSVGLVAVDIWIRTGSVHETPQTNGVSHFIEHLMFRATENREQGQIDLEIESLGATAHARVGRDWTHFYTVVASRYLSEALDVLTDAVTRPLFRPSDVEHERRIILDEIARRESNPQDMLETLVFEAAYSVHPYGLPIEGTRESIAAITREMIAEHYERFYVPENMNVVLVGNISHAEGVAAAKKAFAHVKRRSGEAAPAAEIPTEPKRTEQTRKTVKRDTNFSYLAIAFQGPSVRDVPDIYAMDVLMSHLGVGYQSWLAYDLRDTRKLAVETSADFLTQRYPGLAILAVATQPDKVKQAEEAILDRIAELRKEHLSEGEMIRAQRSLLGHHAFDVETFAGRATNLGFYESIDSHKFAANYVQKVGEVTAEDVLRVAQTYLDPEPRGHSRPRAIAARGIHSRKDMR